MAECALTPLGGPTLLVEVAGLRLLVDPTFDDAGEHPIGRRVLTKTSDAIRTPEELGRIDAVLLSHDQHPDNLDRGGRAFLSTVPLVLTTELAADRLDAASQGLAPWQEHRLGGLTITAIPAQHGPDGSEHLTGPVIGFVLQAPDSPTISISGDNASLEVVRQVAERMPRPDVAVLFAGAARTPVADGFLTLTSTQAVEATRLLGAPRVLVVHTDGWEHFTEDAETVVAAFREAGLTDSLIDHTPGTRTVLGS